MRSRINTDVDAVQGPSALLMPRRLLTPPQMPLPQRARKGSPALPGVTVCRRSANVSFDVYQPCAP